MSSSLTPQKRSQEEEQPEQDYTLPKSPPKRVKGFTALHHEVHVDRDQFDHLPEGTTESDSESGTARRRIRNEYDDDADDEEDDEEGEDEDSDIEIEDEEDDENEGEEETVDEYTNTMTNTVRLHGRHNGEEVDDEQMRILAQMDAIMAEEKAAALAKEEKPVVVEETPEMAAIKARTQGRWLPWKEVPQANAEDMIGQALGNGVCNTIGEAYTLYQKYEKFGTFQPQHMMGLLETWERYWFVDRHDNHSHQVLLDRFGDQEDPKGINLEACSRNFFKCQSWLTSLLHSVDLLKDKAVSARLEAVKQKIAMSDIYRQNKIALVNNKAFDIRLTLDAQKDVYGGDIGLDIKTTQLIGEGAIALDKVAEAFVLHSKGLFEVYQGDLYVWKEGIRLLRCHDDAAMARYFRPVLEPLVRSYFHLKPTEQIEDFGWRKLLGGENATALVSRVKQILKLEADSQEETRHIDPCNIWLPVAGGMVGNMKTGEIRKRVASDMFSEAIKYKLLPKEANMDKGKAIIQHYCMVPVNSKLPLAERTYQRCPSKEKKLLRMSAVMASPETQMAKILYYWTGERHTGKTTYMEGLRRLFGKRMGLFNEGLICEIASARVRQLDPNSHSAGRYACKGKSGLFCEEPSKGAILVTSKVKDEQGALTFQARPPNGQLEEFPNTGTKCMIGNNMLSLDAESVALGMLPSDLGVDVFQFQHVTLPGVKANDDAKWEMWSEEAIEQLLSLIFWDVVEFYQTKDLMREDNSQVERQFSSDPLSKFVSTCLKFTDVDTDRVVNAELWEAFQLMCSEHQPALEHKYKGEKSFAVALNKAFIGRPCSKDGTANNWTVKDFGKVRARKGVQWDASGFSTDIGKVITELDGDGKFWKNSNGKFVKRDIYDRTPQLKVARETYEAEAAAAAAAKEQELAHLD